MDRPLLSVPDPGAKELEVEQISVLDDGSERFSRWARGPEDTINVFLNGQASERQNLTLHGRLPASPGDTPLPVIRVEANETKAFAVQLYRDSAVQLEVTQTSGLAAVQSSGIDEARASLGHRIKELRALPNSFRSLLPAGKAKGDNATSVVLRGKDVEGVESISANLRLKSNRPKIRGDQITSVRSVDGSWETEADFRLTVTGGIVDELRVDAPAEWPGPYKIQPPAVLRTIDAGKGRKQLIIRPQTPIEKEYRLRVWGPLVFAAGDRPSVPHVLVEQAEMAQHLVVVPIQSLSEPLAWEIRGLDSRLHFLTTTRRLPAKVVAGCLPGRARAFPGGFELPRPGQQRAPRLLADVFVAWQDDGVFHGRAAFDLEPAGLAECSLHLPPEVRLIHVGVDDVPAMPVPCGENRWQIPLGPSTLPQRIEILFDGEMAPAAEQRRWEFAAPDLVIWRFSRHCGPSPVRVGSNPRNWTMRASPIPFARS